MPAVRRAPLPLPKLVLVREAMSPVRSPAALCWALIRSVAAPSGGEHSGTVSRVQEDMEGGKPVSWT